MLLLLLHTVQWWKRLACALHGLKRIPPPLPIENTVKASFLQKQISKELAISHFSIRHSFFFFSLCFLCFFFFLPEQNNVLSLHTQKQHFPHLFYLATI